eukprot:10066227-Prorocentrum_lima.AAC.1
MPPSPRISKPSATFFTLWKQYGAPILTAMWVTQLSTSMTPGTFVGSRHSRRLFVIRRRRA